MDHKRLAKKLASAALVGMLATGSLTACETLQEGARNAEKAKHSCKGSGSCKAGHSCKGQNSCAK